MGVWISTDPAEQFFNPYGYHTNPILFVDPNGETFVQLLAQIGIGMATSALQYAANPNNYGDNFGEGFGYALLRGALSGGLKYGTNYFLGNILPTIPTDNPALPIFVNGGLEIAMHGVGTMFIDAAIQKMRYGEVDWGQAAISGGVAAAWTTLDVAINGAIVNERSLVAREHRKELNKAYTEAKGEFAGKKLPANYALKYNDVRVGGIKSHLMGSSGLAKNYGYGYERAWVRADDAGQWRKAVIHEVFHLYSNGRDYDEYFTSGGYDHYSVERFAK